MSATYKRCACGVAYTRKQWEALPEVATQRFDWGEVQQMKNCTCGSTMAVVLEPGEKTDPVAGAVWRTKNKSHARVKVIDVTGTGVAYKAMRGTTRGFMGLADFYKHFEPVRRTS